MAPVVAELKKDSRFQTQVLVSAQHRLLLDQVLDLFHVKTQADLNVMKEKQTLFDLLGVSENLKVDLTESFAMKPASSVSGLYFSHPDSAYFGIGKINRDQVVDYANRKGVTIEQVEKWLGPNLSYSPKKAA